MYCQVSLLDDLVDLPNRKLSKFVAFSKPATTTYAADFSVTTVHQPYKNILTGITSAVIVLSRAYSRILESVLTTTKIHCDIQY